MSATGWYGPLIDLSKATSHVDDGFVQLLVFVRHSRSSQNYKGSTSRTMQWIDLSVGDDTVPYFSAALVWKNYLRWTITPGTIIFLQNVKLSKYKYVTKIFASEVSALRVLVGQNATMQGTCGPTSCQTGTVIMDKLKRMTEWILQSRLWLPDMQGGFTVKNWISQERVSQTNCFSISEILRSANSGVASFHASICEVILVDAKKDDEGAKPKRSISEGLCLTAGNILDDLICFGCKICGVPLTSSSLDLPSTSFYCKDSSDRVHVSGSIYKPFMLRVRDQNDQLQIMVKNNAADILFGNITAENVTRSFKMKSTDQSDSYSESGSFHSNGSKDDDVSQGNWKLKNISVTEGLGRQRNPDFYNIWLILLKSLLKVDKNSPFKFEVIIDASKDQLDGKFELVSLTMPCCTVDACILAES